MGGSSAADFAHVARTKIPTLTARLAAFFVRVAYPLIGVCLLTAGLWGVLSFGVQPAVLMVRSLGWQAQTAVLESATLRRPSSRLQPPLDTLEVRYRYVHGGTEYSDNCLDVQSGLFLPAAGEEVLAQLRASRELTIWVNPAAPGEALARRDFRWPVFLFVLPALAMGGVGGRMVYLAMLAWNGAPAPGARRPGTREGGDPYQQ